MGSTTERRKHKRHQYEAIISHDILAQEVRPAGKMYNFSKHGLYFESNHSFYPMEEIFVEIIDHPRSSDTDLDLLFDVEVIWRKKLQDTPFQYGYGAKFKFSTAAIENKIKIASFKKQPLPQPKLALPQPTLTDETEAREFPRKRCHQSIVFNHRDQVYKGLVTNISRGGAFINTRGKFSLGRKIKLVITGGKIRKDIERLGWIVRVNSEGFGVSFDRRSGSERRYDLDRRFGKDRRKRTKPVGPGIKGR